jgi:hypothetical protein
MLLNKSVTEAMSWNGMQNSWLQAFERTTSFLRANSGAQGGLGGGALGDGVSKQLILL